MFVALVLASALSDVFVYLLLFSFSLLFLLLFSFSFSFLFLLSFFVLVLVRVLLSFCPAVLRHPYSRYFHVCVRVVVVVLVGLVPFWVIN